MAAILEDGVLRLSGYVGEYYYEDGFTSADVVSALSQIDPGSDLTVHVNSPGGIAYEGAAIHAVLSARRGVTDVVVEGVAMSAASLIAMAGATVTMSAGAVMMIHDPSGFTFGTSDEHTKTIAGLEALATAYARVYADKSGKSVDECREIMKAETWFTPEQAVAAGFADETTERKAEPVAAFDYRVFANAPRRLVAMAKKKDWRLPDAETRPAPQATGPSPTKETSMTEKERADALSAELETLKATMSTSATAAVTADRERRAAIMALPETAGREPLAEHLYATGKTVDEAKATLAVSGKTTAAGDTPANDATEHQNRRLNGDGLSGQPTARFTPGNGAPSLVATMRKQLGKEPV
ncbi:head maturation protease, ClpP-related [Aureimonas pseudogalii]|uniref:ATP-dependent Clp protease proteolytic subunit n=1 Tax=Aureimonas pseudogalii TaxID=1744844 RepID=A0A7W6H377_9HYPH|nr:head maturation protease, ClpP-related [Aureimonas pseudogalii]MBB3996887.1 ATP-dependent protease ClpP protease subunit [Aureimonas pseudogalii]